MDVSEDEQVEKKVEAHTPRAGAENNVTDLTYCMNGFLKSNLDEVPRFLKKAWDCVVLITGSGKVRIGKSTLAIQCAYYLAWLLNEQKKKKKEVPQDNLVPFDNSNVAFDPESLMRVAQSKPRNSVLVYDEGRAGLDSARAMENINKVMQDFFQECGQYGHIIFIVLPDFFKLQETIAVPRSLFLINVYTDKNYNRGYFCFYNEHKKEILYILGKKKWGTTAKYFAVDPDFHGKYPNYFPIDKEIYDENKRKAIKKRRKTALEYRWHHERDILMWILRKKMEWTFEELTKEMNKYPDIKIAMDTVKKSQERLKIRLDREGFEVPEEEIE